MLGVLGFGFRVWGNSVVQYARNMTFGIICTIPFWTKDNLEKSPKSPIPLNKRICFKSD